MRGLWPSCVESLEGGAKGGCGGCPGGLWRRFRPRRNCVVVVGCGGHSRGASSARLATWVNITVDTPRLVGRLPAHPRLSIPWRQFRTIAHGYARVTGAPSISCSLGGTSCSAPSRQLAGPPRDQCAQGPRHGRHAWFRDHLDLPYIFPTAVPGCDNGKYLDRRCQRGDYECEDRRPDRPDQSIAGDDLLGPIVYGRISYARVAPIREYPYSARARCFQGHSRVILMLLPRTRLEDCRLLSQVSTRLRIYTRSSSASLL